MEAPKILVVDDESRMRKLVKDFLEKKNFHVLEAGDGEEAMDIFYEEKDIALLILDVMMPKMDEWEVCREIRKNSKVPIIMLTARGDERDELLGFELGVDEYISKPFSPRILVARVDAILRRTNKIDQNEIEQAGDIEINKAAHLVKVHGEIVDLSFKEFELLTYFVENEGIALSREKILNNVWNYLKNASEKMYPGISNVIATIIIPSVFGIICFIIIFIGDTPSAFAARTNSCDFS